MTAWSIEQGDVREVLAGFNDNAFDALACDPPYGFSFMGKSWDYDVPSVETWRECLRVLKPGAPLVAFGGSRTYHRLACGIEDAGFELRDMLMFLYGTGFPKSLQFGCRCGEASTKRQMRYVRGADLQASEHTADQSREVLLSSVSEQGLPKQGTASISPGQSGTEESGLEGRGNLQASERQLSRSEVRSMSANFSSDGPEGRLCDGASSDCGASARSLSSADGSGPPPGSQSEEQSPVQSSTVREQHRSQTLGSRCETCGGVIGWQGQGTNLKPAHEPIVLARKPLDGTMAENAARWGVGGLAIDACRISTYEPNDGGRWPANLVLDEDAAALLDAEAGECPSTPYRENVASGAVLPLSRRTAGGYADSGGPSRFFYTSKVSTKEREAGCDAVERVEILFQWENVDRKVRLLVDTAQLPPKVIGVSGMSNSSAYEWSMLLFGNNTTEPSLQGIRFITRTKINSTIESKTWRFLARWNTNENMAGVSSAMEFGGSLVPFANNSNPSTPTIGISSTLDQPILGANPVTYGELFLKSKNVELLIEEALPKKPPGEMTGRLDGQQGLNSPRAGAGRIAGARNGHVTLKPIALTTWLARLLLPPTPRPVILVPFSGAGSEMIGCLRAGWAGVFGVEREAEYIDIARARLAHWCPESEAA